jgi:hypothetical protein
MAREKMIQIRADEEFKEQVRVQAGKYGLVPSTYIRMLIQRDALEGAPTTGIPELDGLISGEFAGIRFKGFDPMTGKPLFGVTHNF